VGGSLVRGRLVAERRGCDVKTKKKIGNFRIK
jgi:hypothetical protein